MGLASRSKSGGVWAAVAAAALLWLAGVQGAGSKPVNAVPINPDRAEQSAAVPINPDRAEQRAAAAGSAPVAADRADRTAATADVAIADPAPTVETPAADSGFDWSAAFIGGLALSAGMVVASGLALAVRGRRAPRSSQVGQ